MPTIRVVDDNVIEFVDSNGDVAAREEYDEAASEVSFVDGDGNPMPVSLGDATADSVSTKSIPDVADAVCDTAAEVEGAITNTEDGDQIAIGAGDYNVDNPLTIEAEVKIVGAGRGRTTLNKQNDQPLFELKDSRIIIGDLTGSGLGSGTGTTVGLLAEDELATRTHLFRVGMNNMGSHGFHIRKGNLSRYEEIVAEKNGGDGVHYDEPGGDNNVTVFTNPNLDGNAGDGFHQEKGYNVTIIGGYAAGNGRHGWYHDDNNLRAFGPGGEGNGNDLFHFGPDADEGLIWAGVEEGPTTDENGNNHIISTTTNEVVYSRGARFGAGVTLDGAFLKGVDSAENVRNLIYLAENEGDAVAVGDQDARMRMKTNQLIWSGVPNSTTADGMTADPETDSEDASVTVNIDGTDYELPLYEK